MVGCAEFWAHSPLHPCREIVLVCVSPPPDCGMVAAVSLAVQPYNPINSIIVVLSRSRNVGHGIATAPASPIRMFRMAKSVLDQVKKGRGISFWNEKVLRICRAERSY